MEFETASPGDGGQSGGHLGQRGSLRVEVTLYARTQVAAPSVHRCTISPCRTLGICSLHSPDLPGVFRCAFSKNFGGTPAPFCLPYGAAVGGWVPSLSNRLQTTEHDRPGLQGGGGAAMGTPKKHMRGSAPTSSHKPGDPVKGQQARVAWRED